MTSCQDAVETPQGKRDKGQIPVDQTLAERHYDHASRRGVSTEAAAMYKGRFRVQSARLPAWDYTWNGYYFVTICTKHRAPLLGDITDGCMRLSRIGEIVAAEWREIALRRRDVALDEWVVMPNHLHGIVIIQREPGAVETPQHEPQVIQIPRDTPWTGRHHHDAIQRGVSTGVAPRLQAGSLGAIIGQFKSRSTKRAWQLGFRDFGWQPRFYDHIIRDERSLEHIRQYIIDNPGNWDPGEGMPENLWI